MSRPVATKERIERAALRLFVEQGIAETSIKKIAKAAGVSQGAMYNHYVSKEELAWVLFSRNFSEIGQELRQCARERDGLEARLRAMIRLLFRRFDEDWLAVTYAVFVRHQHIRRVDRRQGNPYLVFRTVIAEAIKSGRDSASRCRALDRSCHGRHHSGHGYADSRPHRHRFAAPSPTRSGAAACGCLVAQHM